jgi:hypothetical protein
MKLGSKRGTVNGEWASEVNGQNPLSRHNRQSLTGVLSHDPAYPFRHRPKSEESLNFLAGGNKFTT